MSVACAVLAAGGSTRLGQPKQLLAIAGVPMLERTVQQASASRCEHLALILGASASTIMQALGESRATRLYNPGWQTGLASSLHVAVRWAEGLAAQALLICVCDQPHLTTAQLDLLYVTYQRERVSVASSYGDTLGVPAVLDASTYPRLLTLCGDRGAASVLRSEQTVARVPWPEGAIDLDTPADVERFRLTSR